MTDGKYEITTHGSCARKIFFTVKDGKVFDIRFEGGCDGNLKMISKLLNGLPYSEIISKCSGNLCGAKNTSCADQLAKSLANL